MNKDASQKKAQLVREFIGRVVSTKLNKTVVVAVDHVFQHPLYRKSMKRTRKFQAHNTELSLNVGDFVKIVETKPISKLKHFQVKEKIQLNK